MKRDTANILTIKNGKHRTKASFSNVDRLTILNSEAIRLGLIEIATKKDTLHEIDLKGVRFIDSSVIHVLNLLSRMAHRYNSNVILTNVSPELNELIELVKLHAVFDIKQINTTSDNKAAA